MTAFEAGRVKRAYNNRGATCSVGDCSKIARGELCTMHSQRLRRTGDVLTVRKPGRAVGQGRRAIVSYRRAHAWVRLQKGAAASRLCADCGSPAQQWSYDGLDPDELLGDGGRGFVCRYSLKHEHYIARCRTCHKRLDNAVRKAKHAA